jgi:hypothetical protein
MKKQNYNSPHFGRPIMHHFGIFSIPIGSLLDFCYLETNPGLFVSQTTKETGVSVFFRGFSSISNFLKVFSNFYNKAFFWHIHEFTKARNEFFYGYSKSPKSRQSKNITPEP